MHARKIALHKTSFIAIIVTLLVIGSAFALLGNSTAITPQEGSVSYTASYYLGSTYQGPASLSTVLNITTLNGAPVTSLKGATNPVSLPFGSYIFSISPSEVQFGSSPVVVNGTSQIVNVTSSSLPVALNLSIYRTSSTTVTLSSFTTGTAVVSFSTLQGFVFQKNSTSNGTFKAFLPSGDFYTSVVYGGQAYSYFIQSVSSNSLTVNLGTVSSISGFVDTPAGTPVSSFNVVALNSTSHKYSVMPFTSGVFQVNYPSSASNFYYITANGYQPYNFTSASNGKLVYLVQSSSNVTYDYTLGSNPGYLNLTVDYSIGNATALPFLANSSVGSFYWQQKLDSASFSTDVVHYLNNLVGVYSNNSILVQGYNYKSSAPSVLLNSINSTNMHYVVKYEFTNPNVTLSDLQNGFTVKLFAVGTQYMPGALYYNYVFDYNIGGVSLSSPVSVAKTFKSPVELLPQTSSGFLTLQFSKARKPVLVASQTSLYWNNTAPQNTLLTASGNTAVFVAPTQTTVYFNVSKAFYNPVTGVNDYLNALAWNWNFTTPGGSSSVFTAGTYNQSYSFGATGNYTVTVNYTSASDVSNVTTFYVIAYQGKPTASLNVSSGSKTLYPTTSGVTGAVNFYVPQSQSVKFSGYGSAFPITVSRNSYSIPLTYTWYFPGYKNSAVNVTQIFDTPFVTVTGYLNVTSAVGGYVNVTLNAYVNDTTAPSPVVSLSNATGSSLSQPIAGQVVVFSGNSTTDKYYAFSKLNLSWSVNYANGTKVAPGNSTYELLTNNTNLSYFPVKFNTLNSLVVSLKVTNPSIVTAYSNFTTSIVVKSPRLIVQSVYFPTTASQGSTTLVKVNVSNNGTVNANSFALVVFVNGKNVSYQTYGSLAVGVTKQFDFNLTSPSSGSVQFVFQAVNGSQPSFFSTAGSLSVAHNVNPPAYRTPLIIGIVIAVIVIIGVVYYRLSSRGGTSKPKEQKQPVKKAEEKKK